jgi:hypothetical protein
MLAFIPYKQQVVQLPPERRCSLGAQILHQLQGALLSFTNMFTPSRAVNLFDIVVERLSGHNIHGHRETTMLMTSRASQLWRASVQQDLTNFHLSQPHPQASVLRV